jgi:serine/threonine protein kinase
VHRDVKPANILLESGGVDRAYLTDFGLARASDDASLTCTGVVAGTPHYMSPEQADGRPLDQRSDLFSLGSVLYFMATGHPPFRADRPMAVLKRTCHDPHRPARQCNAEIPQALSAIIDRLLEKSPARRFASAAELQQELERVLAHWQQGRFGQACAKPWARWPASRTAIGVLTMAVFAIGLAAWFAGQRPDDERDDTGLTTGKKTATENSPDASQPMADLVSVDPSPPLQSQIELDNLSRMLDELEATPFPEQIDVTRSGGFQPPYSQHIPKEQADD